MAWVGVSFFFSFVNGEVGAYILVLCHVMSNDIK